MASDKEFIQVVDRAFEATNRFMYYGSEIRPTVVWARAPTEFIAEWQVAREHIINGHIDEGVVATVTDNVTAMLIIGMAPARKSVSTAISVQGVSAIKQPTAVEIHCKVSNKGTRQPHATAVFRDKADPSVVYAVGTHTKFFKAGLVESQPRL
ncbi:hypothetical protein GGI26_002484 [Coemansia sp. RSA 1358]|nr:hypothetical protein GGI26_002484 [Coemansia sp. RSA 1358]